MPADSPSFARYGAAEIGGPVVLAVAHAGRDYPAALRAALRVPLATAAALEDRHADALALAARADETLFVAHRARAWIDLNRAEGERDIRVDEGAPTTAATLQSIKLRSGLGLVPRRVGSAELWRRRFTAGEVAARIAGDHRPYHQAIGAALAAARARFGVAVLLDIHSMPPLGPPHRAARLVLGDRFGGSAAAALVARLGEVAEQAGARPAVNSPYAGGYALDRHGDPRHGIHAVQLEFDRALYLDAALDAPGPGLPATAALLRRLIDTASGWARDHADPAPPLAAE